tara:strand:- start:108 stop:518 length:411 start_codon:yes stop_codon:yes gene_type:complete
MKKDLNYIAAVEKAISEKYGRVATQNFRCHWDSSSEKEYLNQLADVRKKKTKHNQHCNTEKLEDNVVIKKRSQNQKTNRTCPVCKTYSFSSKDDLYMNRYECCYRCFVDFVASREDEWRSGKRPSPEELEYHIKRR